MKGKKIFFSLLLGCVMSLRIGYASSEGVYIHDESSVVFHTQDFQIFEHGKPIKSFEHKIEKSSKKKSYIDYSAKKIRRNAKVNLSNKNLNLPKEIKESVKYVKNSKNTEVAFISNTNNSIYFLRYSPFAPIQKIPKSLFLQAKEPFFILKKVIEILFQDFIEPIDGFKYFIHLIFFTSTLFFYLHIREKSKYIAYMLKRGPPYDYQFKKYQL